jgi:hypothetical protein
MNRRIASKFVGKIDDEGRAGKFIQILWMEMFNQFLRRIFARVLSISNHAPPSPHHFHHNHG